MRSYLKIYLLFLVPSCLALSIGFYYGYKQEEQKTESSFNEKYDRLTKVYADQISDIEKTYERLMRNSLFGIQKEISSLNISTEELKIVAKKYGISHLFLINKDGVFKRSTNEDPAKIPNLYSFSEDYKSLIGKSGSYFTTPIIIPYPEKTPHKFLTTWNGSFFIEVGIQIKDIAQNLSNIIKRDSNILQADLLIGNTPFSVNIKQDESKNTINFLKSITLNNNLFSQSLRKGYHEHSLSFKVSRKELDLALAGIQNRYITNLSLTLGLIIFLLLGATNILRRTMRKITANIFEMASEEDYNSNLRPLIKNRDFEKLIFAINKLLKGYRHSSRENIKSERDMAYQSMARQVAHDIRSPLEALKSSKDELSKIGENDRLKLMTAINRIEEIAYNLLQYKGKNKKTEGSEPVNIYTAIESIIIEKRMQYRAYPKLKISNTVNTKHIDAFVTIAPDTIKRILSNLVSNSAEALNKNGEIQISSKKTGNFLEISINDNGPGIPTNIIDTVTEKGFSTKENGNGLGLFHAKEEILKIGGRVNITSNLNGTTVSLEVPLCSPPKHFLTNINLAGSKRIIILDDDPSIHLIWKERFSDIPIELEHFYKGKELLATYSTIPEDALLLSDFELLGEKINGLDCIKQLGASQRSVLVTARADESEITSAATILGIKVLSKSLSQIIPIKTHQDHPKEIVLIDDDELVHMSWTMSLSKEGVRTETFFSINSFLEVTSKYPFETPIYIDSNLGPNLRGEILSEKIANLGFTELYIATGYDPETIERPNWIKEVRGKTPPVINHCPTRI